MKKKKKTDVTPNLVYLVGIQWHRRTHTLVALLANIVSLIHRAQTRLFATSHAILQILCSPPAPHCPPQTFVRSFVAVVVESLFRFRIPERIHLVIDMPVMNAIIDHMCRDDTKKLRPSR